MEFGVSFFPTDTTMQPVDFARAAEERGFESMWFAEHSHIPTSRQTPWGGVPGAKPLPERYRRTLDQLVALAACAAVTERVRLCTGVTLVAQRDPIWLAKEIASLDVISGGRVAMGIGYGWNKEEMAQHGVAYAGRRELFREKILMMKALWTQEVAAFEGRLLRLEPSWAWPKPLQHPHPPLLLGAGAGPRTIAHMVELCDGWIPLGRHDVDAGTLESIRNALHQAGRDAGAFDLTYFGTSLDHDVVRSLEDKGFRRAVFAVGSDPPDEVVRRLDELAEFAESYRR